MAVLLMGHSFSRALPYFNHRFKENRSMSNQRNQGDQNQSAKGSDRPKEVETYDPLKLVRSGGFDGDPQEILGNPAVVPEMIQEGRDLRPDLFREADEASPDAEA